MKAEEARRLVRCAVYTRKSSEEGLEQNFNSLDAQREGCEAFIVSHKQEGWRVLGTRYDDGGFSGGTLERPALKRLLADVESGKVDTIVVYKVDRLTRSLSDFAKIIEVLERRGASFISVTQHFNTTTSMGRLTLNVLLSFAQFEREVTGERIRDKVAASKRKGTWMGGHVPLGYELNDHKLEARAEEAEFVRALFLRYLDLRSIPRLKADLDRLGTRTKVWMSRGGRQWGGALYSRGELHRILTNCLYVGEVRHKDRRYPGEHTAIVPRETWDRVQAQLMTGNHKVRNTRTQKSSNLLAGLLEDDIGQRFTCSFTLKKGRKYRYYVCESGNSRGETTGSRKPVRLPAQEIEEQVMARLRSFLGSQSDVLDQLSLAEDATTTRKLLSAAQQLSARCSSRRKSEMQELVKAVVRRITVHPNRIELSVSKNALRRCLRGDTQGNAGQGDRSDSMLTLLIESGYRRCRGELRLLVAPRPTGCSPVTSLVKAVARSHDWCQRIKNGEVSDATSLARRAGIHPRYVRKILDWAFLAPDIVEAVLHGQQPLDLTLETFRKGVPLSWEAQRCMLGVLA